MQKSNAAVINRNLFKKVERLMGNRFEITVVADSKAWAEERIGEAIAEIRRIEKLFTTFDENSQVNCVNQFAGIRPVQVDTELIDLIERSKKISAITQGAFDITYGSVDKNLWNFDRQMTSLPDAGIARKLVRLINYKNVETDRQNGTVFLRRKGMRIGFGGIGKGYAADMAKKTLVANGVTDGIVNAAGDLTAFGHAPGGSPWTIGIANPVSAALPFSALDITNSSVATSGNYEKFVIIGNKRYSHTIDPGTGLPVSGIKSVTIICKSAELADALATPVMIMGMKVGLNMINQLSGVECIIIDDDNVLYTSKNILIQE